MSSQKIRRFNLAAKIQALYILSLVKKNESIILDLGAGDGELSLKLTNRCKTLYSVDKNPIRINRLYNKINGLNNKYFILNCCSAKKLPYDDSFFDIVICNSVLEHIENYEKSIKEIYRVTKNNGLLFITVPNSKIQFGCRFSCFWNTILRLPVSLRKYLCRERELAELSDTKLVRDYFMKFFRHKINFTENKIIDEVSFGFKQIYVRYYMNYLSAFFHDLAYYFKIFNNNLLLYFCYFIGYIEYLLVRNAKGKGIMVMLKCIK